MGEGLAPNPCTCGKEKSGDLRHSDWCDSLLPVKEMEAPQDDSWDSMWTQYYPNSSSAYLP